VQVLAHLPGKSDLAKKKNNLMKIYYLLMSLILITGQAVLGSQASLSTTSTSQFPPLISIFGDRVISERLDAVSIQFEYGVSSYDVASSTGQTGLVQSFTSMAIVSTGIGQSATAKISSLQSVPYYPGHDTYVFFTAVFFQGGAANSTQWIGIFSTQVGGVMSETDGAAVGYSGTNFSVLFRQNSVDTIITQTNFNVDELNGTGPSGYTINPTKINVFRIAFGWLGAAPIQYQILTPQGTWQTFHQILLNNTTNQPTFLNPNLPITMAVANNGNTTNVSIGSGSWNGGSIQQPTTAASRFFPLNAPLTIATSGTTETYVINLINPTTYNGVTNRIVLLITYVAAVPYNSTSQLTLVNLRKNATVTGTVYTENNPYTVLQFSTAGTFTPGSGTLEFVMPISNLGGNSRNSFLPAMLANNFVIMLNPGDTLTISVQNLTVVATLDLALTVGHQEYCN